MNAKKVISYFWQQARRYRLLTLGTLIMPSFAMLVHTFLSTLIVATIIDKLAQGDYIKHDFIGSFGGLILLYIGTYLLGNVLLYRLVTFLSWRLDMRITRAINMQVFQHLLTLDTNFHANRLGGTLVTQASKLSSAYERFSDTTINSFLPLVSTIIFTTVILLPRAPLYLPILFLLAAGYLTIALKTSQRIRHFNTRHAKANSHQFGLFADAITNIFTVKSFGREAYETRRYKLAANKTFQASDNLLMATINRDTKFSLAGSSFSIASIITVVIGVMYFNISLGTAFLMLTYSLSIAQRLWDFSSKGLRQYNQVFGEAHEMLDVLNTEPGVIDHQKTKQAISSPTGISFNAISFSHPDTHEALFDMFSLTIKPGEKVGLVGHSGAGKSSLASLLLRFSEIDAGTIKIGQHDITSLSQEDLRHHIAYVPQEPLLFHRSIKENISYGKPAASDADIEEAARRANAYDFINKLPQGFDTFVGERGIKLSGGQRQRIAIARAILKDAPILVLDEATSALDSESEKFIQASLDELMKDRTALVIAHRLSTIAKLDRVVVMEHGRIIEDGTHKALLKKQGVYAKLWQHQSGGFIEE